ncbi:hypothetical protein AB0M46_23580 [Dactylosporangium sp. NPDC051485]|uniref:hypothetical protein n=1 Tax=Dactylosporangium sp. NPDC051485 TaxID=3154846 RepID=UPI00343B03B3
MVISVAGQQTLLAVLVERSELTHEETCEGYRRCARDNDENAALSLRTLRRWIAGDVVTRPRPAQARVARIYWGYSMDQLLAPAPDHNVDAFAYRPSAVAEQPIANTATSQTHKDLSDPSDIGKQVAMSARRAARFTTFAEESNIGREAIDQLRDDVTRLASDYLREPLSSIMSDLLDTQDSIFGALTGRQRPTWTSELFVLAGMASGLLSKASHDLGRPREAMTQARTMYVCAENAGHVGLQAWARGQQALIAFRAGRPQEAVRYSSAGAEISANLTGSVTAWLPALRARALAQLSEPHDAREELGRAADRRDQVRSDDLDEVGGLLTFSEAKQHYYAAGTYVFLDESADFDAERAAQAALDLFEDGPDEHRSFSTEAGARAELALARVHAGALDGARDALQAVLDLDPDRRIGGIVHSVNQVHHALRERRYTGSLLAREMRDEIESFCQHPARLLSV